MRTMAFHSESPKKEKEIKIMTIALSLETRQFCFGIYFRLKFPYKSNVA